MKPSMLFRFLPALVLAAPFGGNEASPASRGIMASPGPRILAPFLRDDESIDEYVQKAGRVGFPAPYAKDLTPRGDGHFERLERAEALGYKKIDVVPREAYFKLETNTDSFTSPDEKPDHTSLKNKGFGGKKARIIASHSTPAGLSVPPVSTKMSARDVRYFAEENNENYCQTHPTQFYRVEFGPLARGSDCVELAKYLEREPGYFLASDLSQLTPLVVMGSCYFQVVRRFGASDILRFSTSDVANVLRTYLDEYSGLSENSVIHNALGTTKCNGQYLDWSITGFYNHTITRNGTV
ncbi:hypothetical protein BROUX41_005112 [Berkeleyomyces rouxiae]|uniref:uncharacterized protein n=1 Tax=Berkeleyomyces rouxiae TaxID=2035830 RepID=UPI003B77A996